MNYRVGAAFSFCSTVGSPVRYTLFRILSKTLFAEHRLPVVFNVISILEKPSVQKVTFVLLICSHTHSLYVHTQRYEAYLVTHSSNRRTGGVCVSVRSSQLNFFV